jgi:isoquinoline 1-oxidoreductase subunit beta
MSADRGSSLTRRDFLIAGATTGAGLALAIYLPGCARPGAGADTGSDFSPSAWLTVGHDGGVQVVFDKAEMGQGVMTALPMIVADELDVDWSAVTVRAQTDRPDKWLRGMSTGGSSSVRRSWEPLRTAGAAARTMLVAAAAKRWGVDPASCTTASGRVRDGSGRTIGYGELVDEAAAQPVPAKPALKDPKDFHIIGRPIPRVDIPPKTDGTAEFGIDVQRQGLLVAVVERCPVFGGKLKSFDAVKALAVPGVRKVAAVDDGVAVIADGYWPAMQGRSALQVTWDEGPAATVDSDAIRARFAALAEKPGAVARDDGDASHALASAKRRVSSIYEVPYLAHATMEPMNCTAVVRADGAEVWVPTQSQTGTQKAVADALSLPVESVLVHSTFLGGGFGRRSETDFVIEAVQAARAAGAPVKVIWSREDDTRHDFYRPAAYHRLEAGLDATGRVVAWHHRFVAPSIFARRFPGAIKNGVDREAVEGAVDMPYAVPNVRVEYIMPDAPVPVGFWRSVNFSHNIFAVEGFIDELAEASHTDPYQFRRSLLKDRPRDVAVLDLAADKAGWGRAPASDARGIAFSMAFGTRVAYVVDVVLEGNKVRVPHVVAAVDCGQYINPDTVEAQIQSAMVYGLTAALRGEITLKNGRVVQGNFDTYPMLRMNEMPAIEVHIVANHEAPAGMGEPGVPPLAPALVNAIHAATGRRLRRLPVEPQLAAART